MNRSDLAHYSISPQLRRALDGRATSLDALAVMAGTDAPRLSRLIRGERFGRRSFPLVTRVAELFELPALGARQNWTTSARQNWTT